MIKSLRDSGLRVSRLNETVQVIIDTKTTASAYQLEDWFSVGTIVLKKTVLSVTCEVKGAADKLMKPVWLEAFHMKTASAYALFMSVGVTSPYISQS